MNDRNAPINISRVRFYFRHARKNILHRRIIAQRLAARSFDANVRIEPDQQRCNDAAKPVEHRKRAYQRSNTERNACRRDGADDRHQRDLAFGAKVTACYEYFVHDMIIQTAMPEAERDATRSAPGYTWRRCSARMRSAIQARTTKGACLSAPNS